MGLQRSKMEGGEGEVKVTPGAQSWQSECTDESFQGLNCLWTHMVLTSWADIIFS